MVRGSTHGSVTVEVPASTANLGPGFDSIGLALGLRDVVTATVGGERLVIDVEGEGAGQVPGDESHLVWQSMLELWRRVGVTPPSGLILHCLNGIRQSRGLGSSASAIVAGVAAALALTGDDLTSEESLAQVAEVAAALEGHPDNASASVYGGLTLSWADDGDGRWRTVRPRLHPELDVVALVPTATLSTHTARAALPASVPLRAAADNSGRAALLVEALTRRPDLLLPATRDWLHQEARRSAYGPSMELVDRLRGEGHGAVISGAGPTVLVLGRREECAHIAAPDAGWEVLRPGIPDTGVRVVSRSDAAAV